MALYVRTGQITSDYAAQGNGINSLPGPRRSSFVGTIVEILPHRKGASATSAGGGAAERRREVRYLTNDPAEVEVLPGRGHIIGAFLTDVSRSGVRLWLKTHIEKDAGVKIRLRSYTIILGTVRYCRPRADGFDAGILIHDVAYSWEAQDLHLHDDELSLYLVGKGLIAEEINRVENHLDSCESCRMRLAETNALLFAARQLTDHQV
jgi:PilZ domain